MPHPDPEIEAAIQAHIALTRWQASGEIIAPAPVAEPIKHYDVMIEEPVQELIIPPIALNITAKGTAEQGPPLKRSQRKKLIE